jgi:Protein of unknown function (DUF2934)
MATRRTTGSPRTAETPPPAEKAAPRQRAEPVKPADPAPGASNRVAVSEDARRAMIAEAAYLRAERRGFTGGSEEEDWLAAEAEVDALLRAGYGRPPHH